MVGTFDAANFGDVLFPEIARHELGVRLGDVEITAYGYRSMSTPHWPYPVRSLGELPTEIAGYDLVLLGGGHLIRDDAAIADGYLPSDRRVHQPLGLWLVPTLMAAAAGVPVAWNAVGVSSTMNRCLVPLIRTAINASSYVATRDHPSAQALEAFARGGTVRVVPDTAFGASVVVDDEARSEAREWLAMVEINDRGYVIVQSTHGLSASRDAVEEAVRTARERDLAVLEIPFGPIVGDHVGAFEMAGRVASFERWPPPKVFTALIGGADAIIHQSLHAGIVGWGAGVPCLRRPMPAGKHDQLDGLPGVHLLGENGAAVALSRAHDRTDATAQAARATIRAALDSHWDTIADLTRGRVERPSGALVELVEELPGLLQDAADRTRALESGVVLAAEFEAAYRAFANRTTELSGALEQARRVIARREAEQAESAVVLAQLTAIVASNASELERLRERDVTLTRIVNGGWWRLRGRLRLLRWLWQKLVSARSSPAASGPPM